MAEMSPLRRRMIEDITVRNLSPATQRSYVHAVSRFSQYFGRSDILAVLRICWVWKTSGASRFKKRGIQPTAARFFANTVLRSLGGFGGG